MWATTRVLVVEVLRKGHLWLYYNVELTGFLDRLGLGYERKRSIKADFKWFGLSSWKNGIAI